MAWHGVVKGLYGEGRHIDRWQVEAALRCGERFDLPAELPGSTSPAGLIERVPVLLEDAACLSLALRKLGGERVLLRYNGLLLHDQLEGPIDR